MSERALRVSRVIAASAERLFAAWTTPDQLLAWWGPGPVRCIDAEVDLRVGGRYRLGNQLADGAVLWITGQFTVVEPPRRLVYTWQLEGTAAVEQVTVRFDPRGRDTEVSILHEQIADDAVRASHQLGWDGCLDKLAAHI